MGADLLERLGAELADRYTIKQVLGTGGMATVCLAWDPKNQRQVAIKVLHPDLAALIGEERFLAEIRTTANLQHPHILPLFDSGATQSYLYYVMPYVQGESLRARLNREQQLPIADAVRIASEIAAALDYAHRLGVIHRDVKPENVLFHDGRALVADFGIALAANSVRSGRLTASGISLGTPDYMSPEQASGDREITPRSDIYSLGAVAYEMLVGAPPFTGPNSQAVLAKAMSSDPRPLREERKTVPTHVEDAVLTALEKLPADRFDTALAFAEALRGERPPLHRLGRPRSSRSWIGALAVLAIGAGAGWMLRAARTPAADVAPVRMAFRLGVPGVDRPQIDISPDGRRIIQVLTDSNGVDRVVMRNLGSLELVPVAGSEGAIDPVFSLDGQWISYNAEGKLRKVPVNGGPAVDVVDSATVGGGAWAPDGTIIFSRDGLGLWRVPSTGGVPVQLTALDTARKEFNHWYPQVLPGGRGMIYTAYTTPVARASIQAFDFTTRRTRILIEGGVYGRYANGYLLYARDGAIFAVPFDPGKLEVHGVPVPVQEDVAWSATDALAAFAVAPNGTLAYLEGSKWYVSRRVVWADRTGKESPAFPDIGAYAEPRISPDGRWIVITRLDPRRELWLFEVARGVLTPLSQTGNAAFNAIWMPDSRSVVYIQEDPVYDLDLLPIDGSAPHRPLVHSPWDKFAASISPDGKQIAYVENKNSDRLWIARIDGSEPPRPLTANGTTERGAAFSPDGRWIAYEEDSHGVPNVYIVAVNGTGARRQVSVVGGEQPLWTRGGREIVYRRGDAMMAVAVEPATGTVATPVELFRKPQVDRLGLGRTLTYDVSADGNRFLLVVPEQRAESAPTVVVLNWFEELKTRVGSGTGTRP